MQVREEAVGERSTLVGTTVSYKEIVVKWEGSWRQKGEIIFGESSLQVSLRESEGREGDFVVSCSYFPVSFLVVLHFLLRIESINSIL